MTKRLIVIFVFFSLTAQPAKAWWGPDGHTIVVKLAMQFLNPEVKQNVLQVLILENKEPDDDIKGDINYTHFSGKTGIGRKGFFE